ncbi:hypothetical protein PMAYCL1PPCAC_25575, partial [Pristionchus mayeri]
GDFAEKGKDEVEIKDVDYEEVTDLFQLIFDVQALITDSTLPHVLALGDRFQMKQVIAQSEIHLMISSTFSQAKKLLISDQYRLDKLKNQCLLSYTTVTAISVLESAPEFAQFSEKLKVDILHRTFKIANAST